MKQIMTKDTNKFRVIFMTLVSALLFCSLIVAGSLSPLTDSGPKANKFGTYGMWASIGMILVFYILPLILYMVGVNVMKIVMAVFCGFGILTILTILVVILTMGKSPILLVLCIATLIANILWYFMAFHSPSKLNQQKRII
ncbi:DUF5391 family protein [Bacillus sp. 491mf]|uniref:DUF5391 family protein n=1 Tax=Bacillus sp. 491mf TaxID=1761755 RepID=UPI00210AD700|nr:DUF5391 family protein [Bacillus sp. 491mf]